MNYKIINNLSIIHWKEMEMKLWFKRKGKYFDKIKYIDWVSWFRKKG